MRSGPRHVPYARGGGGVRLGLRPLPADRWLERDGCAGGAAFEPAIAAKRALLSRCGADVYRALEGSEDGQREIEQMITAFVGAQPGAGGVADAPGPALQRAGLLVADDLCLLEPRAGRYVLTAGFVCAPSYWRLADKIGLVLAAIHAPVPEYREKIGRAVDRTIESLVVDRPLWRMNWGIAATPEPYRPQRDEAELEVVAALAERAAAGDAAAAQEAGRLLHVRVERQSLRRLPRTGGAVFTIRVHIDPLEQVAADRDRAAGLHAALAALSAAELEYKGIAPVRDVVLAYLSSKAAPARGPDTR